MDGDTDAWEDSDDYEMVWRRFEEVEEGLAVAAALCYGDKRMPPEFNRALLVTAEAVEQLQQRIYTIREWHHEIDPRKKDALAARIALFAGVPE